MILLAYGGAALIAVLAITVAPRWLRSDPELTTYVRLLAGPSLAGLYALVATGVVLLASSDRAKAAAVIGMVIAGLALFVAGLVWWKGSAAWLLRLVGWLLLVAPVAVPSHLTLILPLVAPLAVTLRRYA